MKRIKVSAALLLAALGVWLVFTAAQRFSGKAPNAVFTTLAGEKIALRDWLGKPVVVTFWATDCPSCILEIPHLAELYRRFHAQGLEMVAVAMAYDPPNRVVEMTRNRQLPYHVALDLNSAHAFAFGDVRFTPTTFLIDPQGRIAEKSVGVFDFQDWQNRIAALLSKV